MKDKASRSLEVVIMYIGHDTRGTKTEDYIIAETIYRKFKEKKISSQIFDMSYVSSDEAMKDKILSALDKAKIILLIGTKSKRFHNMEQYLANNKSEKMIVPVYSKMTLSELPAEVKKYQAQNYESIGAVENLMNSVCDALGRSNLNDDKKQNLAKRRLAILLIILSIILIPAIVTSIWLIVGQVKEAKLLKEKEENYQSIQRKIEEKDYGDALDQLFVIEDYKDAQQYLKKVKNVYAGYYKSDVGEAELHLSYPHESDLEIQCKYLSEDGYINLKEIVVIDSSKVDFFYADSQSKTKQGTIEFTNQEIRLSLDGKLLVFALDRKTDKPMSDDLTREKLVDFLEKEISVDELMAAGHILEYDDSVGWQGRAYDCSRYVFKDTNIYGIFGEQSISFDDDYNFIKIDYENNPLSPVLYMVQAPAKLLCSELVGQKFILARNQDFYYINEQYNWWNAHDPGDYYSYMDDEGTVLEDNSLIIMIPRESILGQAYDWSCDAYGYTVLENLYD